MFVFLMWFAVGWSFGICGGCNLVLRVPCVVWRSVGSSVLWWWFICFQLFWLVLIACFVVLLFDCLHVSSVVWLFGGFGLSVIVCVWVGFCFAAFAGLLYVYCWFASVFSCDFGGLLFCVCSLWACVWTLMFGCFDGFW